VVSTMSIIYIRCESPLGHTYKPLTCAYTLPVMVQVHKAAGHRHGVQVPLGHQPFAHAAMTPVPRLTRLRRA
jgi:hypothetical protein